MSSSDQRRIGVLSVALAGLAVAACAEEPTRPGAIQVLPSGRSLVLADDYRIFAPERPLVEIARDVPGFGGVTVDETGHLVAYLTDTTRAVALRSRIEPLRQAASANLASTQQSVIVRQGQYDFLDLLLWRDLIAIPVLSIPGVSLVDLAEQYNRLLIGIHDETASSAVAEVLRTHGIPPEAVLFEEIGPIRPDSRRDLRTQLTLQSEVWPDPIVGGIQNNYYTSAGQYPVMPCTIGFIASWNGQRVWLTNSHCTQVTRAVTSSTTYWQPRWDWGLYTELGHELADPLGSNCGPRYAPGSKKCRHADAAILGFKSGLESALGYIARPVGPPGAGWAGSLVIDEVKGFEIISDDEEVGVFWFVEKVGRTTGWTTGQVLNTCVQTEMAENTSFILECQHRADYVRAEGDSGAPVFSRVSGQSTEVRLFGIHNGADPQGYAYFSPVSGVRADLGPMSMVAPGPPPPPPPPPPFQVGISGPANDLVRPNTECLYTAAASGGTAPYSYSWYLNTTLLGTGEFLYHTSGTTDFTLEVNAVDADNNTAWNALHMTVDQLAPDCLDM